MKTAEEQLTELRISFIKKLYKDQSESVIKAATEDVHLMNFDSNEAFEKHFRSRFDSDPHRLATDDEIDAVLENMGLGGSALKNMPSDRRSTEDKMIDDIMSHL